jgi:hypothetical protein
MQAQQPVAIAVEAFATAAGEAEASGLPREYPRSALKVLMLVSGRRPLSAAVARLDWCALAGPARGPHDGAGVGARHW